MSNGSTGSMPWAMENGEWPIDLHVVARLAQNAKGAMTGHFEMLPLHALMIDS